ncbi:hypothetical protein F4813DRAFT_369447 [Daldinia decipiens]|uniref:uncharacterized protein n=1 Tax=Daldinia decipiens TaxID=326647 RepID=UPI0020C3C5D0|nr:uncharacterized protein F4813DRAFT_369447 [Daldinia decipiens]KAI1654812.1 hypothetical protein F4813DRAFT_369447 [Daldinia decipiens]
MELLRISDEAPSLTTLPDDIFYIVLTYLDTAKSVANLAASSKGLHHLVTESGWRIFVKSRFNTFKLSEVSSVHEWRERAYTLTSQSRDWDRRALAISAIKPVAKHRGRVFNRFGTSQSIPSNFIVDAHHQRKGNDAQELVFWGAGEDIFGLLRHTRGPKASNDEWFSSRGATAGYHSGKDDVTCVSILKDSKYNYGQESESQVLVGRAGGHLHLLSMGASNFGDALLKFRASCNPSSELDAKALRQADIQSLDVNYKQGTLAAATKQSILTYSLNHDVQPVRNANGEDGLETGATPYVWADDALVLKDDSQSGAFEFIRTIKFVNRDTLAVGLNKGYKPLQYLKYTPTGVDISFAAKTSNDHDTTNDHKLRTARAILPVDTSSLGNGSGNAVLSAWDDGIIRLQDLRTPSPVDQIFQDNFDLSTPINALLSRGLERFVAGSAYSSVLKVFDYRWPKGYYHTEALPCGNDEPYPAPRPPTIVTEPSFSDDRTACDYMAGKRCRWHELSQHDYYRPNFNTWLPVSARNTSPIYTLASPSDDSPTFFAGLSEMLVEITPKSSTRPATQPSFGPAKDLAYVRQADRVTLIENGSGFAVDDILQSQRVPPMYRQIFRDLTERDRGHPERAIWRKRNRLDEWLQRCA